MGVFKYEREGTRYGMLVFMREAPTRVEVSGKKRRVGVFRCDCGHVGTHMWEHVRGGKAKSCGCTKMKKMQAAATKHGYAFEDHGRRLPEYRIWVGMRTRCFGNGEDSRHYGKRGITICEQWSSFPKFYEDMGPRPSPQHSIDRIDVNGNYCPENCRWATREQQASNKRCNIRFTFYGMTKLLIDWSRISQVPRKVIYGRLHRGWPPKYAVWSPVGMYLGSGAKPWETLTDKGSL